MSNQKLRAIYKQLTDKINNSKESAVFEIKELKADLNELQRHLSGRKKATDIQPDDILRSAYEIAHFLRDTRKREEVLAELQDVAAETEAEEYLLSRGAKLLTRPAGWHFQTSKERFLLHENDTVQAAAELRKLLAAGKRLKRPKKKKPEPKNSAPQKAKTKRTGKEKKAETASAKTKDKSSQAPKKTKKTASGKRNTPAKSAKPKKSANALKSKAAAKPAKKTNSETTAKAKKKKHLQKSE